MKNILTTKRTSMKHTLKLLTAILLAPLAVGRLIRNILMATFTEADVRSGSFSPNSRQRVLINYATGLYQGPP